MATLSLPRSETLPFLVDGDARQILHRVEDRPGRLRRTVVHPEDLCIDACEPDGFRGHRHVFLVTLDPRQPDVAEVIGVVERAHHDIRFGFEEAGERHSEPVGARRQPLDDEAAVFTRECTGQARAGGRVFDHHGGVANAASRSPYRARGRRPSRCPGQMPPMAATRVRAGGKGQGETYSSPYGEAPSAVNCQNVQITRPRAETSPVVCDYVKHGPRA